MDALKLFKPNAKGSANQTPTPKQSSTVRPAVPSNPVPPPSVAVTVRSPTGTTRVEIDGRPKMELDGPPVLHLREEEDEGGSSSSGSGRRASRDSRIAVGDSGSQSGSLHTGIKDFGGTPPPGALGAIRFPSYSGAPVKSTPSNQEVTHPSPLIPPREIVHSLPAFSKNPEPTTSNAATLSSTPRTRPPKPNLSIPIPPRTNPTLVSNTPHHERASTVSTSPSTATKTPTSAHPRSASARQPPSPGHTLRLTPSIVMSRPAWPLPPLPPMPTLASAAHTPTAEGDPSPQLPSNDAPTPKAGKATPLFRISPPTRSMTGPVLSSSPDMESERSAARVRRSVSVKLNAIPSLSVMGETERGDPEADDYDDEEMEDEDEMDEEMDAEVERVGRPSIDSVFSMDSVTSAETVRAPVDSSTTSQQTSSTPSPPIPSTVHAKRDPPESVKTDKGKGKAVVTEEDGEERASDSDESVYFDARASVFLSPKDVAAALERRYSQLSTASGSTIGRAARGSEADKRERRDSSWSLSTSGRESVYLTPSEGRSAFHTPYASGVEERSSVEKETMSAFAREAKRASVPVSLGATLQPGGSSGIGARRGGENRLSLSTLAQNRLSGGDFSKLYLDKTPTPGKGSSKLRGDEGDYLSSRSRPVPDGLPPSRREGLPNFDAAKPFTNDIITEDAPSLDASGPRDVDQGAIPLLSTEGPTSSSPVISAQKPPVSAIESFTPSDLRSSPSALQRTSVKRPSVYRQASRSMVDLSTSSFADEVEEVEEVDQKNPNVIVRPVALTLAQRSPAAATSPAVDPLAWLVPPPSPIITRPTISKRQSTMRRVSSFPTLQAAEMPSPQDREKPPPTYESIHRYEDEGTEVLPAYTNDIVLAALVPRKMEFDRPGIQARDRAWKTVWCVLHGTMFRVYKVGTLEKKFGALAAAPVAGQLPSTSASALLSGGKAKHGHSGSHSSSAISSRRNSTAEPDASMANPGLASGKLPLMDPNARLEGTVLTRNQLSPGFLAPPSSSSSGSAGTLSPTQSMTSTSGSSYAPSRSSFSHSRPTTPARPMTGSTNGGSPPAQFQSHPPPANNAQQPQQASRGRRTARKCTIIGPGHGPGGRSVIDNGGTEIYTPPPGHLIHQYSLQGAESGLATDYLKRRNVIRVRLDGAQFLMQLPSVEDVVEWIEGLQAATNIALDLDERPMPKGPMYPRRRRRRRPRQPGELPSQSPLSPPPHGGSSRNNSGSATSRVSEPVAATA